MQVRHAVGNLQTTPTPPFTERGWLARTLAWLDFGRFLVPMCETCQFAKVHGMTVALDGRSCDGSLASRYWTCRPMSVNPKGPRGEEGQQEAGHEYGKRDLGDGEIK